MRQAPNVKIVLFSYYALKNGLFKTGSYLPTEKVLASSPFHFSMKKVFLVAIAESQRPPPPVRIIKEGQRPDGEKSLWKTIKGWFS